jgi:hypothetical protein
MKAGYRCIQSEVHRARSRTHRFTKAFSGPLRDDGGLYGQLCSRLGVCFVYMLSLRESVDGNQNKMESKSFQLESLPVHPVHYSVQMTHPHVVLEPF